MMSFFLSADWSKHPGKRSVYVAHLRERRIRKVTPSKASWNLDGLLDLAENLSQDGPVLIGIDVVLGVPEGYWRLVLDERCRRVPETFVEWLGGLGVSEGFFETVIDVNDWHVDRPWFRVPKGVGGLTSFTKKIHGGMRRKTDCATGAKALFAVSGIPGTVGNGTREVWKELIPHLSGDRDFAIWPFEGHLTALLEGRRVVLCETYPRLAYAAALADGLPTRQVTVSKTKREARDNACGRLAQAKWVRANRIDLGDLSPLKENEDDFDACFTAAAVLRCVLEGRDLTYPDWIEAKAEGSMLLAGVSCRVSGKAGRLALRPKGIRQLPSRSIVRMRITSATRHPVRDESTGARSLAVRRHSRDHVGAGTPMLPLDGDIRIGNQRSRISKSERDCSAKSSAIGSNRGKHCDT